MIYWYPDLFFCVHECSKEQVEVAKAEAVRIKSPLWCLSGMTLIFVSFLDFAAGQDYPLTGI